MSSTPAPQPHTILVTGSSGAVGSAIVPALAERGHTVRGLDLKPTPNIEMFTGSITDAALVDRAVAGVSTVIHLAGVTDDADFMAKLLPNNIVAVHQLFEAARRHAVKRVILASTIQAAGRGWRNLGLLPPDYADPGNGYALTKLFAEDMGRMYAHHGMSVICARIGFLPRNAHTAEAFLRRPVMQNIYLSYADCGRFFVRAVEAADITFAVLWAMSRREDMTTGCDLAPSRALIGYEPQDRFPAGLPWPVKGA